MSGLFLIFIFVCRVCKFLGKCQNSDGGFAGGPGQFSHLATTYAAVNCICDLATEEAYSVINRCGVRLCILIIKSGRCFLNNRCVEVSTSNRNSLDLVSGRQ